MELGHAPLFSAPAGVQTRWATAENPAAAKGRAGAAGGGRKGAPAILNLAPGATQILAEAAGSSGVIRRIWITITNRNATMLRGLRLEMFWDNAKTSAVSAPLGDFFGHMLGRMAPPFQSALFSSPEGRSFNCCIPMPFRISMKITLTNDTDRPVEMVFYEVDFTLNDPLGADALYFHAFWNREPSTALRRDFEILPKIVGRGRYLATAIGVSANMARYGRSWWGEGEVKVFLDGDQELPSLCGTGTEDFIGTGWSQGRFDHLYQGCQLADDVKFNYGFYRQHIPDPIFFQRDIRLTIQQIGCWDPNSKAFLEYARTPIEAAGLQTGRVDLSKAANAPDYGIYEREQDDWSSCAYFYLDRTENGLPALPDVKTRLQGFDPQ
jgi:hypothetical protein